MTDLQRCYGRQLTQGHSLYQIILTLTTSSSIRETAAGDGRREIYFFIKDGSSASAETFCDSLIKVILRKAQPVFSRWTLKWFFVRGTDVSEFGGYCQICLESRMRRLEFSNHSLGGVKVNLVWKLCWTKKQQLLDLGSFVKVWCFQGANIWDYFLNLVLVNLIRYKFSMNGLQYFF